mgnify:CR=1 FL=1
MLPAKVIWKPILQRWITGQGKPFRMRPANPMIASGLERIGLYLHVPFCASMCPFCPYNRVPYDETLFERYRRAVCQEIDACAPSLDGVKIGSLYVGGGTPTVNRDGLVQILQHLRDTFTLYCVICVEIHPAHKDDVDMAVLADAGVTLLSVGVESTNVVLL